MSKKYAKVKGTIGDYLDESVEVGVVYYHHNNLGSTRVMTNQDGEKVFDQDYLPFGGDLPKAGQLEVQNETGESYKYTGQKQVASIGLYYYSARYYDPAVGRFTRQDSYRGELAKPQTQHLYVYVTNNPLKFTDPTGHRGVSDFITNPYEALKDAFNSMFKGMGEQSSTGNNQTSSGNGSSTQGSKGSKGKGGSIGISKKEQQKLSQLQSKARENNTEVENTFNITVKRQEETSKTTLGELYVEGEKIGYTLERAWKNNKKNVSRIPAGTYPAHIRDKGNSKWPYNVIQLDNVPNRTEIQFHNGNVYTESTGCFLPGKTKGEVDTYLYKKYHSDEPRSIIKTNYVGRSNRARKEIMNQYKNFMNKHENTNIMVKVENKF